MKAPETPRRYSLRRIAVVALGIGYLLTWVFGVPAVVSHNDQWVVGEYKRVVSEKKRDDVLPSSPGFFTFAAFPALPGVVLSARAYQVAGRYGWGGVQADVWWPGGVWHWFAVTLYVS